MSNAASNVPPPPPSPPPPARGLATLLAFLVPGLGHIVQGVIGKNKGRLSKGVFFLVVLLGMFLLGMVLGEGKNVFVPQMQAGLIQQQKPMTWFGKPMPHLIADVYTRLQYAGQFWIGLPAWPALWNYYMPDAAILEQYYGSPGALKKGEDPSLRRTRLDEGDQQASDRQFQSDKQFDIGWVYTVIAGVLNILVIYDAWAGSVVPRPEPTPKEGGGE